ncbi:MAG: hypothetical protein ACEPO2_01105 [Pelagibaca sp.]
MKHFKTILAAVLATATISAVPAPAKANDADMILRLLNGFFAQGYSDPRVEYRGQRWNNDDDDGFRRGRHDDDDDGYRGRGRNDDDDDDGRGRRYHDDDD